jgi:hypothetical protein
MLSLPRLACQLPRRLRHAAFRVRLTGAPARRTVRPMPWEIWKGKKQSLEMPKGHRCDKPALNAGKGWHALDGDRWRCPGCLDIYVVGNYGGPAQRQWGVFSFDDQMHDLEIEMNQAREED